MNSAKTKQTVQEAGSDAALLEQKFKIDDPEALSSLSLELPDDYKSADVEHWYDVSPPSGKLEDRPYVWCAHDQKETHWKGYVMKTPSGVRFLIGNDCGEEIYGHDFNLTRRNFQSLQNRQYYLFRWKATLETLPAAIDALSEFLKTPVLRQFEEVKSILEKEMRDLYEPLKKSSDRLGGVLTIEERIRDFQAENLRDSRHSTEDETFKTLRETMTQSAYKEYRKEYRDRQRARDTGAIYRIVSKEIGRIAGPDFLQSGLTPTRAIANCIRDIGSLHAEMNSNETEQYSYQKMSATLAKIKELIASVEVELRKLRSVPEFLSFKNVSLISDWASKVSDIDSGYKVSGGILIKESSKGIVKLSMPPNYKVPMSIGGLEALKLALTKAN